MSLLVDMMSDMDCCGLSEYCEELQSNVVSKQKLKQGEECLANSFKHGVCSWGS